jgi:folate-dependent phosphoribosylglycinamide formyltransferase PurN
MDSKIWIALFSQTGSELLALQKKFNRKPDFILTNSKQECSSELDITIRGTHDELMGWLRDIIADKSQQCIITLHGYLRIIPEDICNTFNMYNGHPGFISRYPELKGKDPQVRTWQNNSNYPIIGSVVHKVTAGVDEGEIVSSVSYTNRVSSEDEMFNTLKQTSFEAWYWFLRNNICE